MDGDFELPLSIPCRPSQGLAILSVITYAGAVAAVLMSAVPVPVMVFIVTGLAAGCIRQLFRLGKDHSRTPPHLILTVREDWRLVAADGTTEELVRAVPAFVHPWLVILHFASGGGSRHVFALTPDNTEAETLRRLRVRLRFPLTKL